MTQMRRVGLLERCKLLILEALFVKSFKKLKHILAQTYTVLTENYGVLFYTLHSLLLKGAHPDSSLLLAVSHHCPVCFPAAAYEKVASELGLGGGFCRVLRFRPPLTTVDSHVYA